MEVYIVVFNDEIFAFDEQELAFREAADIAYKVAQHNPQYYDFDRIDELVSDAKFEKAVKIFNETDWIESLINVRKVYVQSKYGLRNSETICRTKS